MLTLAIKTALKRGALVTAANWEVVVIQFVAESAFKGLLIVPALGAAFLVALMVGADAGEIVGARLQDTLALVVSSLDTHPGALFSYFAGLAIVIVGGSVLMFVIKAGGVPVLVDAEREAPAIEHLALTTGRVARAGRFSLERFGQGIDRFAPRFIRLGLVLLTVYAAIGIAYVAIVMATYRWSAAIDLPLAGSMLAAGASLVLAAVITFVNLAYLLVQVIIVARDCSVRAAARELPGVVAREARLVAGIFVVMLAIVGLATIASILATGALGFIGFVPIVGLALLPLQLLAWLARGLLFQFLGLAALGAYAGVLRGAVTPASDGRRLHGGAAIQPLA